MSAAMVLMPVRSRSQLCILPRVWATASLADASKAVHERQGPQRLRLVTAAPKVPRWEAPTSIRTRQPEIAVYREYTEAMLRRYSTMAMEQGRVPSLLGRELFRGNVTSYKVQAFDDVVIFVHDMEKCIAAVEPGLRYLIRRVAIEGYTQEETAGLSGLSLRAVVQKYGEALDKLTRILLDRRMLEPIASAPEAAVAVLSVVPARERPVENPVKGAETLVAV
jgi:predicted DNA-binding protein (UPF0251 family)